MKSRSARRAAAMVMTASLVGVGMAAQSAGAVEAGRSVPQAQSVPADRSASVPRGFASWDDVMREQQRLNKAATAIEVSAEKRGKDSGLAGIRVRPESRRVVVYWKGAVPKDVRSVIDRQRRKVPVRVVGARYSKTELLAESRRLQVATDMGAIAPRVDGSGLTVKLASDPSPTLTGPSMRELVADSRVDVDIAAERVRTNRLTAEKKSTGAATAPYADPCPYKYGTYQSCRAFDKPYGALGYSAGARTQNCTTNFAVYQDTEAGRVKRMVLPAHCGELGSWQMLENGTWIGQVVARDLLSDTALATTFGSPYMWTGDWKSQSKMKVSSVVSRSYVDNLVCTSGARSGEVCNNRVYETDTSYMADGLVSYPMVYAENESGLAAAGPGDSGGPVFEPIPDNTTTVVAKGMISSAILGVYQCNDPSQSACGAKFYYSDMADILPRFGAVLQW
ncbi:hypothetical protein ABT301_23320 [Streptomyces sp. NPDC000987]|uniref:hypothetical protein n=1 Tax=Streptomyces sp. NPDC000987 TaxID=3154374 RepID=UPI00331B69C4